MPAHPYLFFNGNCAEAMKFYEAAFGGKLEPMFTYGQGPEGSCPAGVNPDAIMHAALTLEDGGMIMASDDVMAKGNPKPQAFAIAIGFENKNDVTRVFATLAEGGQTIMPLGETFWTDLFGMTTDRYGVLWMVSTANSKV